MIDLQNSSEDSLSNLLTYNLAYKSVVALKYVHKFCDTSHFKKQSLIPLSWIWWLALNE